MTTNDELKRLIAEAEREEDALRDHVPDRDETRRLLNQYFVGPIREEHVERLFREFNSVRWDVGSYQAFFSSRVHRRGFAWREEFSKERTNMVPTDHLLLKAHMMWDHDGQRLGPVPEGATSFPQPKLCLDPAFIGTWRRLEPPANGPEPVVWQLDADGSFHTNETDPSKQFRIWCCYREWGDVDIVLRYKISFGVGGIDKVVRTGDELRGSRIGYPDDRIRIPHVFQRI